MKVAAGFTPAIQTVTATPVHFSGPASPVPAAFCARALRTDANQTTPGRCCETLRRPRSFADAPARAPPSCPPHAPCGCVPPRLCFHRAAVVLRERSYSDLSDRLIPPCSVTSAHRDGATDRPVALPCFHHTHSQAVYVILAAVVSWLGFNCSVRPCAETVTSTRFVWQSGIAPAPAIWAKDSATYPGGAPCC